MSGTEDRPHDARGAPVPEGRRRLDQEAGGVGSDGGAPVRRGEGRGCAGLAPRRPARSTGSLDRARSSVQPFVVTFRFATMPIVHGACTLDAVLGGELARGVERLEDAIRATPLACTDAVSHGSSLRFLDDTGVTRPVAVLRNARAALLALPPDTTPSGRRPLDRLWVKHLMHRYEARFCAGGAWLGTGRREEVEALLSRVLGIGKRRGAGWGMIEPGSLVVDPVAADPATWGLVSTPRDPDFATERVVPVRPLPLETFRRLGGDPLDAVIATVRVRQPYYAASHPPEAAVVPWPP